MSGVVKIENAEIREMVERGEVSMNDVFKEFRFKDAHHLGLGDIRLTIAQQDEINNGVQALLRVARDAKSLRDAVVAEMIISGEVEETTAKAVAHFDKALKEVEHLL